MKWISRPAGLLFGGPFNLQTKKHKKRFDAQTPLIKQGAPIFVHSHKLLPQRQPHSPKLMDSSHFLGLVHILVVNMNSLPRFLGVDQCWWQTKKKTCGSLFGQFSRAVRGSPPSRARARDSMRGEKGLIRHASVLAKPSRESGEQDLCQNFTSRPLRAHRSWDGQKTDVKDGRGWIGIRIRVRIDLRGRG